MENLCFGSRVNDCLPCICFYIIVLSWPARLTRLFYALLYRSTIHAAHRPNQAAKHQADKISCLSYSQQRPVRFCVCSGIYSQSIVFLTSRHHSFLSLTSFISSYFLTFLFCPFLFLLLLLPLVATLHCSVY